MLKFNARGNFSGLIQRRMKNKFIRTIFYRESDGMMYHLHEVGSWKSYENCVYMETFENPNTAYNTPSPTLANHFFGCIRLRSIKMPKAIGFGHYVFTGLPNLEYLQLGSIGHAFVGSGAYYRNTSTYANNRKIGSDVGLRIDIYVDPNAYTRWSSPFASSSVEATTKIYYYDYQTGEYLQGVNVDE